MKTKHLLTIVVALLAVGGLWVARTSLRTSADHQSSPNMGQETTPDHSRPGQTLNNPARLAPPDPTRRFRDFTPEQRVEFARKGHGPGG